MVELARVASVAAVVEPSLLRRLRLEVPGLRLDAGAEADLWFSRLVHVATATQLTLRPDVAEVLRGELSTPRWAATAHAARGVVVDAHRGHSDMLRLEETLVWAVVTGDDGALRQALDRALATVRLGPDRAPDVVRWFRQARRRLPARALRHPVGQELSAAVALHIDRVVPAELLTAARFPRSVGAMAPTSLPATTVGVELVEGGLRFGPASARAGALTLPETRPLVVEVSWTSASGRERTAVVRADPGTEVPLEGLGTVAVLRTLTGRRFAVSADTRRCVVVAVFADAGSPASGSAPDDLARAVTELLPEGSATVRLVREPADLADRPEVFVVLDPTDRAESRQKSTGFAELLPSLGRLVGMRPGGYAPLAVVWQGTATRPLVAELPASVRLLEVPLRSGSSVEWADLARTVAEGVRFVVDHPDRAYRLDVDTALEMLQSVALAFHVGAFHREEVGSDGERALFGLGPEGSPTELAYRHVRAMCEWVFGGPVRDFFSGGPDPSVWDPAVAGGQGPEPVDSLRWSPSGQPWASFDAYLSWLTSQLHQYVASLRDRLGARRVVNSFPVAGPALQLTRVVVGASALPPGDDVESGSSGSQSPRYAYRVERATLPHLLPALVEPVLEAARAEAADRRAGVVVQEPLVRRTLTGRGSAVTGIDWDVGTDRIASVSRGVVTVWAPDGTEGESLEVGPAVTALRWDSDGRLGTALNDGTVQVWQGWKLRPSRRANPGVRGGTGLAWSWANRGKERGLLVGTANGDVVALGLGSGPDEVLVAGPGDAIVAVASSRTSDPAVAWSDAGGRIGVWRRDATSNPSLPAGPPVVDLAFLDVDGEALALAVNGTGAVAAFDLLDPWPGLRSWRTHVEPLVRLACSDAAGAGAALTSQGRVALWSAHDAASAARVLQARSPVTAMAWSPDGRQLALGLETGDIDVAEVDLGRRPAPPPSRLRPGPRA